MANYFSKALSNFVQDFANGGAIRHLADLGYTVSEITKRLDFPVSKEKAAEIVWHHFLDTGIILMDEPPKTGVLESVTYVKEQGKYGRITMRKVVEQKQLPGIYYVKCDFWKHLYQDKTLFLKQIQPLSQNDRDYILDLPWPLQTVYHVENERMRSIKEQGVKYGFISE